MATAYTETPDNFSEVTPFVETEIETIKSVFYSAEKVVFYDACSFQRHSHLPKREKTILMKYFKSSRITVFITKCILMELASERHDLPEEYIEFIRGFHESGTVVVIFNEEFTYHLLSECFSTNERINEYLAWAVRMVKSPVSTIEETLKRNSRLASEVIEGKNLRRSDLYDRFFSAVRGNKEHADNLGEELIAVCMHILSHLPGVADGKLCVITDDKGAAAKIYSAIKRTNPRNRGAGIIIFSTPKLVVLMLQKTDDGIDVEIELDGVDLTSVESKVVDYVSIVSIVNSEEYKNGLSKVAKSIRDFSRDAPNEATIESRFDCELFAFFKEIFKMT